MGSIIPPANLSSLMLGEMALAVKIRPKITPALIKIADVLAITHINQNFKSVLWILGAGIIEVSINELRFLFCYIIIKTQQKCV
jgi:hypothetical protein